MIPVPKTLFKYVYDEKNRAGLVFLTLNNPYLHKYDVGKNNLCKEYIGCRLLNETFTFGDVRKGYTYCCLVEDFFKSNEVKMLGLHRFRTHWPLINRHGRILLGDGRFMKSIVSRNRSSFKRSIFWYFFTDPVYLHNIF